jgi:hypothetical protein
MSSTKQECARALAASILALAGVAFTPGAGAAPFSVGPNNFFDDGATHSFLIGSLTLDLQGAAATAPYTFLFQESGFSNRFEVPGGTLIAPDLSGSLSRTYTSTGAPPNFNFVAPLGTVTNAGNTSMSEPNFGVLLNVDLNAPPAGPVRTALASQDPLKTYDAVLFLNDKGAGQDRDFDDLVLGVTLHAVPEPGTSAIIVAGLVALFGVVRRQLR